MKTTRETEQKNTTHKPKNNLAIPKDKRVLDNLARLMEMSSKGCTAVCYHNDKILISDNDIHSNTKSTQKTQLITNIMQYFREYSSAKSNSSGTEKKREKVFKEICVRRINGEEAGYIKLSDEVIETIALDVLSNRKEWRQSYEEKSEKYSREQRPYVATTYELVDNLARNFVRVERFIEENKDHPLTKAVMPPLAKTKNGQV